MNEITTDRIDDRTAVVRPTILADNTDATRLRDTLLDLHRDGVTQYVIDLASLKEVDRTSMSVLYRAWRRAIHNGGGLSFAAASPAVRKAFEDIRLPGFVIADVETALHRTMAVA